MIGPISLTTSDCDRQLVNLGIEFSVIVLWEAKYHPEKLNDYHFAKLYKIAQKFDKVFKDKIQGGIFS